MLEVICGPNQEFVAPNWPPFVEQRFEEWQRMHDRPASLSLGEARRIFAAGWNAAVEELSDPPKEPKT